MPKNPTDNSFPEILKEMIGQYGQDVLKDPARVNALLTDLAPDKSKQRALVCRVLREGAGAMLLAALGKPEAEQQAAVNRCIRKIKDNTYISEDAITLAVRTIAEIIGLHCPGAGPDNRGGSSASPPGEKEKRYYAFQRRMVEQVLHEFRSGFFRRGFKVQTDHRKKP